MWAGDNRYPQSTWEERKVLEWKPRLFALILVVVLIGLVSGWFSDAVPMNWEW